MLLDLTRITEDHLHIPLKVAFRGCNADIYKATWHTDSGVTEVLLMGYLETVRLMCSLCRLR